MDADLTMLYLKDNCELLLRVDRGTAGWQWIYRRMPSDCAGERRIIALLNRGRVAPENVRIRVLLFPPEILTLSLRLPAGLDPAHLRQAVCGELLPALQYPDAYDLQTLALSAHGGQKDQEIVLSLMGRAIIPGILSTLDHLVPRTVFLGDALQFLELRSERSPRREHPLYRVALRIGERYFVAGFRHGRHSVSCSLSHATDQIQSSRHPLSHVGMLNQHDGEDLWSAPLIQIRFAAREWSRLNLPKHAYAAWVLTQGVLHGAGGMNQVGYLRAAARNRETRERLRRRNYARGGSLDQRFMA